MNIRIIENSEEALQVIIKCRKADDKVIKLRNYIELYDNRLTARLGDITFLINAADVFYFESVDDRTFLYTEENVYEVKSRLYELETSLSSKDFLRISKSQIVNVNRIKALVPELNRSVTATLTNGELLTISRRYTKTLKALLGI